MKKNRLQKDVLAESFLGMNPAKTQMISARTRELALIAGRTSLNLSQVDYEKAKLEYMGSKSSMANLAASPNRQLSYISKL